MPGFPGSTLIGTNALLGLLAAALWGGGDFSGSIAVKRTGATIPGALRVVVIGHLLSLGTVTLIALLLHEPYPHSQGMYWGLAGGAVSGISLVAFYIALASGHMGSAAAVSGLLCAAVPAVVSAFTEGNPGWQRLAGFVLAGAAIWLIASSTEDAGRASRKATVLSVLGGLGFGIYFVALKVAGSASLLWSMASARVGSASMCAILLLWAVLVQRRDPKVPSQPYLDRRTLAWIIGGAVLDTGGNLSFIAATRAGRLDVAAVLASIYPAGTILLAALVLHEKTARSQKFGMALALVAVVMITLQ